MAANKVIYVPKGTRVQYTDTEGNQITEMLQSNKDYQIDLKDGRTIYATVGTVKSQKKPDGERFLIPNLILTPGYDKVLREADSHTDSINLTDVQKITAMHGKYVEDRRNYKQAKEIFNEAGFTFAFDNPKYPSQYRITVFKNEFLSLVVRNDDKKSTFYGHITDVDKDSGAVTIDHYSIESGVRKLISNHRINVEDLLGIYRYKLTIEPWRDMRKSNDDLKDPVVEDDKKDSDD